MVNREISELRKAFKFFVLAIPWPVTDRVIAADTAASTVKR